MAKRPALPPEPFPPPPFDGFGPGCLDFLRGIAATQSRDWYNDHKTEYEAEVRQPLAALVAQVSDRLAQAGLPLCGDPKKVMFRLHRDTRFSNDKTPYKTHAGASLTRNGDKMAPGMLYLHIDPKGSFVAAGFYHPDPPIIACLRQHLIDELPAWSRLTRKLEAAGLSLGRDDTLARPPRGLPPVPDAAQADIRLKSWVVHQDVGETSLGAASLVDTIVDFAAAATPLLRFGWAAIDNRTA